MNTIERIQVVLASPSDLSEERQMVRRMVDEINTVSTKNGIYIDLRMWEKAIPGTNENGPQGLVDLDLEIPCADIFICLYWKKVGTIIPSEGIAGTEHELNLAIDSFRKNGKPDIKAFFKTIPEDAADSEEALYIKDLSRRIQPLGLYSVFNTSEELRGKINQILQTTIISKAQTYGVVSPITINHLEVSSSKELLNNILPDNRIILEKGFYDILDFSNTTEHLYKNKVYDGEETVFFGIRNLSIIGEAASILARPSYATVLTLSCCENIKFSGVSFGHVPRKGFCTGAVI